ncbi:hypothetical protein C1G86_0491 [Dehalococcoides mccartyi]|uniref:Uncharacterized protein n=1 Tax=Dehalococcoides mccartyi TaxID=61435 RepID=A0A328ET64_9CHLR|nr:hypothetical protein C1G86_0491 [Dehalococcoides mccartyi]
MIIFTSVFLGNTCILGSIIAYHTSAYSAASMNIAIKIYPKPG